MTPAPAVVSKTNATAAQESRSSRFSGGELDCPGVIAGASMGAVEEPADEGRRGEEEEEGSPAAPPPAPAAALISASSVAACASASRSSIAAKTSSSS